MSDTKVLEAAREAYAKSLGEDASVRKRVISGDVDKAVGMVIAIAAINEYRARSGGVGDNWRDDPSADERWSAGLDYGMTQLCAVLDVDPQSVSWDAATETLDGDVQSVFGNIFRAKFGDNWPALAPEPAEREATFQGRVQPWMMACFGEEISRDKIERNHRFLEEALELVQANGCTRSEAHQLVDYTFDRPEGDVHQEVGGVMVTLAALCLAIGEDMHQAGETELARIWTKVEKIRAKQAAKPKHSPLPEHVPLSTHGQGGRAGEAPAPDRAALIERLENAADWLGEAADNRDIAVVIREAIAALRVPDWRAIESAPRDGTNILACRAGEPGAYVVRWFSLGGWCDDGTGYNLLTHWMPLPAAPLASNGGAGC